MRAGSPLPTTRQMLDGAAPANSPAVRVDAVPGAAYRYSGGGYMILQQLVEDVTGRPFVEVMRELVLAPAGMSHSTYAQPLPQELVARAASGHEADGSPLAGGAMVFPEMAPGGLWSTPSDLARFAIELNRAAAGSSDRILDRRLAREMMTRQAGGWGLGVDLGAEREGRQWSHVGTNPGYQSYLDLLPRAASGGGRDDQWRQPVGLLPRDRDGGRPGVRLAGASGRSSGRRCASTRRAADLRGNLARGRRAGVRGQARR